MAWEYYKQEEKYELQNYIHPIKIGRNVTISDSPMKTRSGLLNLYDVIGHGATDYDLFGFAYGCDLIYKVDKISTNQFYEDDKYRWFFSEESHHLKLTFKNENDTTIAKLLLDNDNK